MIIVLEGLEGVGKSTLAAKLSALLGSKTVKTPPPEFGAVRDVVAALDNPSVSFYFYLSSVLAIQRDIFSFKGDVSRHVIVDRYILSTVAYHSSGETFVPPAYQKSALIPADIVVHIGCGESQRLQRLEQRGFHIFNRAKHNDAAIKDFFNRSCDFNFENDRPIDKSAELLLASLGL